MVYTVQVILLKVTVLSVALLSVNILNDSVLNVVMLSAFMQNVLAPQRFTQYKALALYLIMPKTVQL